MAPGLPEPPRSAGELLDALADAMRWPRLRPARLLLGSRASSICSVALCPSEAAIDEISDPACAAMLATPASAAFARAGRRSYDVFLGDSPVDEWIRSERTIIDASEMLAGGEGGLDQLLAEAAGLTPAGVFLPVDRDDLKLVGFVPEEHLEAVRAAVFAAGAGRIGRYGECSWSTTGTGTFRGDEDTSPAIGVPGRLEQVREARFETVVPAALRNAVVRAYVDAHPYEEPAFDIFALRTPAAVGTGRIAVGDITMDALEARLGAVAGIGLQATRASRPAGSRAVTTCARAGAVLAELLNSADVGVLVCSGATDAEATLLAERGISVLTVDGDAMVSELCERLGARLSRALGVKVELMRGLEFPSQPVMTPPGAGAGVGAWRLNFDGGSRGNPGPAAYGFVIVAPDGMEAVRIGEVIGTNTNNVAEYTGLVRGLERALELGVRELVVRGDSELIIKQLRGEYRVRNEQLKPLHEQASTLLKRFDRVDIGHVYRSDNAIADSLVNEALDGE